MTGLIRSSLIAGLVLLVTCLSGCRRAPQELAATPTTPGLRTDVVNGVTTYTNRLVDEKSPYLQLHAHNPVDWYPWGPEAFERARRENKPIFLSIGYSTCHWCHVMEAESFSNPSIAAVMNKYFISIKVDREERPDVDRVYLAYVTSVSGGGWPMSLFLAPDLKPFYGATYLPPDTRGRDEGFAPLLQRIADKWRDDRDAILRAAAEGSGTVGAQAVIPRPVDAGDDAKVIDETFENIGRSFDATNGGFGGSPKFPRPVVLTFLMRYHARTGNQRALEMTLATLRAMADGGIRDQLAGGFHRYTVDAAWRVPHFEKMLYDQAQLATAYTEAFQLTRDPALGEIARQTLAYVLRDLQSPSGGFYSAEDADSAVSVTDRRLSEGAFYLWTMAEMEKAVGRDVAPLVAYHFNLTSDGNVAASAVPGAPEEMAGRNALAGGHSVADTARRFARSEREVASIVERARVSMLTARSQRPRPSRDDKIIAAWNGMMISALARAGQVFGDEQYVKAATAAAALIETRMFDAASATVTRRYRAGQADVDGLLEDYAFLVQGFLDLYEASFEPRWLALAARLQSTQDKYFWDEKDGAYFSTREDAAHLLARMKEDYDGAEPAANSVSAMNLLRLWQLLENDAWRARADATFRALSGRVARSGAAVPQLVAALDFRESTPKQIVVAGEPGAADTQALLRLVHDRFIPNKVLALVDGGTRQGELVKLVPFLEGMVRRNGQATIYVCENYVCRLPTSDLATAARLLDTRPATRN
ncbi:MAG: thioredoxin domain-containing protein [Vicinamibacterales bacterium]